MSIKQEKFSKLNQNRKETFRQVTNAISQLNAAVDVAMKQQAYMRKNPDDNGADQLLPIVLPDFTAAASAFNEVAAKMIDMQAVAGETMTADEEISKYGIDLIQFSNELI